MNKQLNSDEFTKKAVEITVKLSFILLLFAWCFFIVRPFLASLVWGLIIAVSLYPVYLRLMTLLGGRVKLAATLMTLTLLFMIVGPCVMLAGIMAENAQSLAKQLQEDSFNIPLPTANVSTWPLIGEALAKYWTLASTNLVEALKQIAPQLKDMGKWLVSTGFSATLALFEFVAAIIISGVLLVYAKEGQRLFLAVAKRLVGEKGGEYGQLCEETIRSVACGVLGVALIQTLLAGLGFVVADVPWVGLLSVLCFFLAVIQVGPSFIVLPSIVYVFSTHDTLFSLVYMVWAVAIGLIDNVLKPLALGLGIKIPAAIIFIGAIGGMLFSGLIGLFIGAVVLALGYEIFKAWLFEGEG